MMTLGASQNPNMSFPSLVEFGTEATTQKRLTAEGSSTYKFLADYLYSGVQKKQSCSSAVLNVSCPSTMWFYNNYSLPLTMDTHTYHHEKVYSYTPKQPVLFSWHRCDLAVQTFAAEAGWLQLISQVTFIGEFVQWKVYCNPIPWAMNAPLWWSATAVWRGSLQKSLLHFYLDKPSISSSVSIISCCRAYITDFCKDLSVRMHIM